MSATATKKTPHAPIKIDTKDVLPGRRESPGGQACDQEVPCYRIDLGKFL
jgi:hypothetical protein